MKRVVMRALICLTGIAVFISLTNAQSGRDWMTDNADAQRSAWVRSDGKINKDTMAKPGFQFLWKLKLKNPSRQLNSLMPPSTLERLIGYRGFRMLGFVGSSSDTIFTIDTDLGRMEWEKKLTTASAPTGTLACPGGMTTSVVRPTLAAIPGGGGGGGFGRSTPAKSGVGEPGLGAVTLANVRPTPIGPPPGPPPGAPRPNPANPPGGQFGAGPFLVYALAGDGMLHGLHLSNGASYESPIKFLPPNANAKGLIVIDQSAYVVTGQGCGGAANGVWMLDLLTKEVKTFKANVVGSAGMAFGGNDTIYVTTGSGGDKPNSLLALDQKTLAVKASFSAGAQEFSAAPVVFAHKGKVMVAATTKDGRVHLFDSENLNAPLASSAAMQAANPGALASWQDLSGTRWILVPTNNAVVALKVVEQGGGVSLQSGWTSRDLISPLPPTIINGVAFVTSSGEFRTDDSKMTAEQRARRAGKVVIYALDATTGKELWNSGGTITSFARGNALSGGMGQLYLTTHDGTIYAFGFPMEH